MDKDAARPTQQVLLVHGQVSDVIKSCQHVECSCEGFSGREAYLASGPLQTKSAEEKSSL